MDTTPPKNSYGSIFGIIVLLFVIVAGAFYMVHKRAMEMAAQAAIPAVSQPASVIEFDATTTASTT